MIKTFTKKMAIFLLVMALAVTSSISVFASNSNDTEFASEGDNVTVVCLNNGIMPFSREDPDPFTFTQSNRGRERTLDSRYMAYEITLSNSTCDYVEVNLYIDNKYIRSDKFGRNSHGKVDWIDMGYNGNHKVRFTYFAHNPDNGGSTVKMVMYSWN